MSDGKLIEGSKYIAGGFNDIFTNVGVKAKNIVPPNKDVSIFDTIKMVE